jgi:hypothetical protein
MSVKDFSKELISDANRFAKVPPLKMDELGTP